jgi:hypothetical protein
MINQILDQHETAGICHELLSDLKRSLGINKVPNLSLHDDTFAILKDAVQNGKDTTHALSLCEDDYLEQVEA